ncbi:uncharacterized protein LOC120012583 [Tripterygium wilfordii]|uniref:uncharacterized protein LOC120012583 n=1 Tax=Tripterygium wilfordii TaxID=458696 RepID=UPI0018F84D31|nr:uncharacterized protein LOC120012583 [Tripterygium wilfordii]
MYLVERDFPCEFQICQVFINIEEDDVRLLLYPVITMQFRFIVFFFVGEITNSYFDIAEFSLKVVTGFKSGFCLLCCFKYFEAAATSTNFLLSLPLFFPPINGCILNPFFIVTDSVNFTTKLASSRKVKRRWQSREDRGVERERAVVFVPSDGGVYLSGSESEGPDWSIGWVEPHGPNFRSDDEIDDGFAVLVPCYRPGCKELVEASTGQLLSAINNLPKESSSVPLLPGARLSSILISVERGKELYEMALFSSEFLKHQTAPI